MFLERVSKFDIMKQGMCPNRCGPLTILKRRQAIMYMIPMDLIEELENKSEGMYGYVAGVCPECGFILITDNKETEEAKLKPSCYGGFGSKECIIVDCHFSDSCEIEETESFKKAQEAEGQ